MGASEVARSLRSPLICLRDALLARPGEQELAGVVLGEWTAFEPLLEQERKRLADDCARRDAEDLHHLAAVELYTQKRFCDPAPAGVRTS